MNSKSPFSPKDLELQIPLPEDDHRLDPNAQLQNRKALTMLITRYQIIKAQPLTRSRIFSGPNQSSASHKYWGIEAEDWHRSYVVVWSYARSEPFTKLDFKDDALASKPTFITTAEFEILKERDALHSAHRIENLFMQKPSNPACSVGHNESAGLGLTTLATGADNNDSPESSRSMIAVLPLKSSTDVPESHHYSLRTDPRKRVIPGYLLNNTVPRPRGPSATTDALASSRRPNTQKSLANRPAAPLSRTKAPRAVSVTQRRKQLRSETSAGDQTANDQTKVPSTSNNGTRRLKQPTTEIPASNIPAEDRTANGTLATKMRTTKQSGNEEMLIIDTIDLTDTDAIELKEHKTRARLHLWQTYGWDMDKDAGKRILGQIDGADSLVNIFAIIAKAKDALT